jgi:hypothetical protein
MRMRSVPAKECGGLCAGELGLPSSCCRRRHKLDQLVTPSVSRLVLGRFVLPLIFIALSLSVSCDHTRSRLSSVVDIPTGVGKIQVQFSMTSDYARIVQKYADKQEDVVLDEGSPANVEILVDGTDTLSGYKFGSVYMDIVSVTQDKMMVSCNGEPEEVVALWRRLSLINRSFKITAPRIQATRVTSRQSTNQAPPAIQP